MPTSALGCLQHLNAWLNRLFYHELLIGILSTVKSLIIMLNDYNEFRTVLQDMFLVDMLMLLMYVVNLNWVPILEDINTTLAN